MNTEYNKISKDVEQALLSDDVHIYDLVGAEIVLVNRATGDIYTVHREELTPALRNKLKEELFNMHKLLEEAEFYSMFGLVSEKLNQK